MTKRIWFISLAIISLLLSCKQEGPLSTPTSPESQFTKTIHYKVQVNSSVNTRASLNEHTQYVFEASDRLFVSHIESGNTVLYGVLSLMSGAGSTTAIFEGDLACLEEFDVQSSTPIDVVLVSSQDRLHSFAEGKITGTTYPDDECASNLAEAVQKFSHFTCSTTFGATSFTLSQQSAFLVFFVKFDATEVPVATNVTAKVFNNNEEDPIWTSVVSAAALGSNFSQVNFVIAFPGDNISLTNAKFSVQWGETTPVVFDDVTNTSLAANSYYTISRATLPTYDGFRIKATVANTTVTFDTNYAANIEYSQDGGYTWTSGATPCTLVNVDDEMCVRGNRTNYTNYEGADYDTPSSHPLFSTSNNKLVYIAGNIMSLLNGANSLEASAFHGTFSKGTSNLTYIDISETDPLYLPVTTLSSKCYTQMFRQCTSLTHAPTFTVNIAANRCCYNMFRGCSSLSDVSTISLPATTMVVDCYREMFRLCSSLTSVDPNLLPATTLATSCYQQMFQATGITTAPNLPATALVSSCYSEMFRACASLNYIKCLAQTGINSSNSTKDWVKEVSASGTFVNYSGVSWPTGNNGIPSGWTVQSYSGN